MFHSLSREIDMESVVGDHELTVVPQSLMTAEGKLLEQNTSWYLKCYVSAR